MSRSTGDSAEDLALGHLQARGLRLIERNYRCRQGEIDLVMREDDSLVFVEVRYRRQDRFGSAAETVNAAKQARLLHTARYFLQRHPEHGDRPCRFDVVGIQGDRGRIEWYRNAFGE